MIQPDSQQSTPLPPTTERIPNPDYTVEELKQDIVTDQQMKITEQERLRENIGSLLKTPPTPEELASLQAGVTATIESIQSRPYNQQLFSYINNLYTRLPGVKSQWEGAENFIDMKETASTKLKQSIKDTIEEIIRAKFDFNNTTALIAKSDQSRRTQYDPYKELTPEETEQLVTIFETVYTELRKLGFTHEEIEKHSS